MSDAPRAATRADVARLAGVSASTVTYALSGERQLAPSTVERVMAAVRATGYTPNRQAQSLAGGRSHLLAVALPIGPHGVLSSTMEYVFAAMEAATESGYELLLWPSRLDDDNSIGQLLQRQVGGVILMEVFRVDARIALLQQERVPFVLLGRPAVVRKLPYVDADFSKYGAMALQYLKDLGHLAVALVSWPVPPIDHETSHVHRIEVSMRGAAAKLGIELETFHTDTRIAAGRRCFDNIWADNREFTAIVGNNELAMMGILEQANARGLRIPDDLSTIQVEISDRSAEDELPTQTTVRVDMPALGRMAVDLLLPYIDDRLPSVRRQLLSPQVFARASTGPARSRRADR